MSFGFSPTDIVSLIKLAKTTYDDCSNAPQHFGEAGRGAKSLHLVFQSLESEVSNPDSLLNRDAKCKSHIAEIAGNCKIVLSRLDCIVVKYSSLGSSNINPIDRWRLPRKEILEIQGKLRCHQTHLISYLEMIGVSALGRVEQKFDLVGKSHQEVMEKFEVAGKSHEEVMSGLDAILRTVDQIGAEIRAGMHPESLFSDHTDDDKEVWKTLRSKLIKQGFTSRFIQPHENKILERVKEMNELGLWDSDAHISSDDAGFDTEVPYTSYIKPNSSYLPAAVVTDVESGFESEATLPPRPSKQSLRHSTSNSTMKSSKRASVPSTGKSSTSQEKAPSNKLVQNGAAVKSISKPNSVRRDSSSRNSTNISDHRTKSDHRRQRSSASLPITNDYPSKESIATPSNADGTTTPKASQPNTRMVPQQMRVWTGKDSRLKLKAQFIHRSGDYIHLREGDGGETIILATNLSRPDQDYIESLSREAPEPVQPVINQAVPPENVRPRAAATNSTQLPQQAAIVEPEIEYIYQEKPETLVGERSNWKSMWKYRTIKTIPFRRKGYDCDALPLAASQGQYNEVKRLLAKGADIESNGEMVTVSDGDGGTTTQREHTTTALYRSAMAGYFNVAHLLLDSGANVETNNLLHKLASSGHTDFTRLLLEYNARPSRVVGFSRRTALHVAAHKGYLGVVDILLEYGASIDARDNLAETPLYIASMEARTKIVQHLLREGANTSHIAQDGQTALYKACGRGFTDVVLALLRYGADPNLGRGVSGETMLFKTAKKGHTDIVHELLRYGADPNLANDTKAWPVGSTLDNVVMLLKPDDSNDSAKNNYGQQPLYAAAEQGHLEIVRLLLTHGAAPDTPSPSGETPLYAAARKMHRGVVDVLMKAGAQLAPQAQVDDVLRLMNTSLDEQVEIAKSRSEKPKRVQVISELLGRFSAERFNRGVESWKKRETVQGIDLVTEMVKRMGEGKVGGLETLGRVLL